MIKPYQSHEGPTGVRYCHECDRCGLTRNEMEPLKELYSGTHSTKWLCDACERRALDELGDLLQRYSDHKADERKANQAARDAQEAAEGVLRQVIDLCDLSAWANDHMVQRYHEAQERISLSNEIERLIGA